MSTYAEHQDRANLEQRLRVLTNHEERARMARALEEYDAGCITLWMRKHELQARLREAGYYRLGV